MSAGRNPLLQPDRVSAALCRMDEALNLISRDSPPEIRQGLLAGIALAEGLLNQPRPPSGRRPAGFSLNASTPTV